MASSILRFRGSEQSLDCPKTALTLWLGCIKIASEDKLRVKIVHKLPSRFHTIQSSLYKNMYVQETEEY